MNTACGRILIVDDDAALLKVMESYLSRLGYRVDACRSAVEALQLVGTNTRTYVGALIDLNLPGMGGEDLGQALLGANPEIRLVMMSGYPEGRTPMKFELGRVGFLQKPFAPSELAGVLAG